MSLSKAENHRIASYLRDYAQYLTSKAEKEYSAVVRLMIAGAIADIEKLAKDLEAQ